MKKTKKKANQMSDKELLRAIFPKEAIAEMKEIARKSLKKRKK